MIATTSLSPFFIEVPLSTGEYQIGKATAVLNNAVTDYNVMYEGKLYTDETTTDSSANIDIQPILSNYFNLAYVSALPRFDSSMGVITNQLGLNDYFKVIIGDSSTDVCVSYNYTDNTALEAAWDASTRRIVNHSFQDFVYNHTYISVRLQFGSDASAGSSSSPIMVYYYKNGVQLSRYDQLTNSGTPWRSMIIAGELNAPDDADEVVIKNVSNYEFFRAKVKHCIPKGTFIIYFTNLEGGCDWIYCDNGKSSVTVNKDNASMQKYATIANRQAFGKFNYTVNTFNSYTLQTEVMSDEKSEWIPELFLTPYVWVYDVDKDRINSVLITDKSLKIKKFGTDKVYNYTVNCEGSQVLHMN